MPKRLPGGIGIDYRGNPGRDINCGVSVVRYQNQPFMFGTRKRAEIRTVLGDDDEIVLPGVWENISIIRNAGSENVDDKINLKPALCELLSNYSADIFVKEKFHSAVPI